MLPSPQDSILGGGSASVSSVISVLFKTSTEATVDLPYNLLYPKKVFCHGGSRGAQHEIRCIQLLFG